MTELFDIFDEALQPIGVKPRAAVHRDGDWHQVFHCWVLGREDDGDSYVILQKRAEDRDYGGKIDISAAGHLEAGETVRDGLREIREELGLCVNYDELLPLGLRLGMTKQGDLVDCQICHVFFYECDRPLSDYRYSTDEIAGLLKLRIDDGVQLLTGERASVDAPAVGLAADTIKITANDFIPSIDNYVLKALLLARRHFAGEKHLWI